MGRKYRPRQPKPIPLAAFLETLLNEQQRAYNSEATWPFLGKKEDHDNMRALHRARGMALSYCLTVAEKGKSLSNIANRFLEIQASPREFRDERDQEFARHGWIEGCGLAHALALQAIYSDVQQVTWLAKKRTHVHYPGIPGTETVSTKSIKEVLSR